MTWDRIQSRWMRPYYRPNSEEALTPPAVVDYDGQSAAPFVPQEELDNDDATPIPFTLVVNGGNAYIP